MSTNHEQDKKFRIETKVNCFEFSFYVYAPTKEHAKVLAFKQVKTLKKFRLYEILDIQECQECQ